ncbi:MAG: FHA domain-containing protein, partial [Candidatus Korobacteraceae bacterium]
MDPRIIAVSGPLKDQVFRLADGRVSVGRDPSNRVPVRDVTVSRQHCVIEMHDGRVEVTDLESHNGTFVNGIPVNKRTLQHGDVLRVGQSELLFLTEATAPELPPRVLYSDETTTDILKTVKLHDSRTKSPLPPELGRMARDLNALVKISRTINSTRDPQELQRNLLECIFEVVPADFGAILLMDQAEEEPTSICSYDREGGDS